MKASVKFERANQSPVLRKHGVRDNSVGDALNDIKVMNKKQLRDLVADMMHEDATFSIPQNQVVLRIVAMFLAQKDRKFAVDNMGEDGLIPFRTADFAEAMEYAMQYESTYRAIWEPTSGEVTIDEETGEAVKTSKRGKRGRKGDAYAKVAAFLEDGDNRNLSPKDAAKQIAQTTGVAETTALQYTYKWLKENGMASKVGKRGRKATIYPKVVEFMEAHPELTTAKDAAIVLEKELGIAKGTATAYAHKYLKLKS